MTGDAASRPPKERLDEALVRAGLADTRSKARALILARHVMVNDAIVDRAGAPVKPTDLLALVQPPRFVSRGGEKLDHALDHFAVDVTGLVAADLGASTGGFTDCLLQRGAARVYAVDVGYGQLAEAIRTDPRVVVMDRTNARALEELPEPIDLVVIDVSFISLALILPAAANVLRPGGRCIALVKPQFEAGKADVGKGGVVRDPAVHRRVLGEALAHARTSGFTVTGLTASPLRGPAGNIEFLLALTTETGGEAPPLSDSAMIDRAMQEATAS